MKTKLILPLFLILILPIAVVGQDIDKALTGLSEKLATLVKENGKKKVTVLDFTDLHGNPSGELGKYIAEQMTVEFVMMGKRDFSVLDRANLRKILAEHKLTATGLVDPENAKKIGQFAGLDALILGTIIPKGEMVTLNVKIITTDTAEIVGAARGEFKSDENTQKLVSQPPPANAGGGAASVFDDDKAKIVKTIGDLRVEIMGLAITRGIYTLSYQLSNLNSQRSIAVALENDISQRLKSTVSDPDGNEFNADFRGVSGIKVSELDRGYFYEATLIPPKESISGTVKFGSSGRFPALAGSCRVQLAVVIATGPTSGGSARPGVAHNIVGKIDVKAIERQ